MSTFNLQVEMHAEKSAGGNSELTAKLRTYMHDLISNEIGTAILPSQMKFSAVHVLFSVKWQLNSKTVPSGHTVT